MMLLTQFALLLLILCAVTLRGVSGAKPTLKKSNHTSNHAVILSASRFWFNYRHVANALSIYSLVKKHGIPDKNIILLLADEIPGNPRNPFKNKIFTGGQSSLFDASTQIDYRGEDVTVDALRKAMLGTGGSQRVLHTDADSNVLIYWTGHGGDNFFKFQDVEEITATDIADILNEMEYRNVLFLADTCQAFTLGDSITAPNVYMIGSSLRNENSYAHHSDPSIGLSVIERYTHRLTQMVGSAKSLSSFSIQQMMIDPFDFRREQAHVGVKQTAGTRPLNEVPLSDFFSNVDTKNKEDVKILEKPSLKSQGEDDIPSIRMWDGMKAYLE
mmetsp:Transcript_18372/g.27225  ORF Transcript_18372/g.27225 Transcript_18372/m.27225 type:complete len:329 (+) Transcript_18372:29-1015(+)